MRQQFKKPKTELNIIATELLKANSLDTTSYLNSLSNEGHLHLAQLETIADCDDPRVYSLDQRLKRVDAILEDRERQRGEVKRRSA